jgi:protein phosphatase slingshot
MINSKDDYGSMSSIAIRNMLEKELQMTLDNFKKFVDITIFQFYNQLVECASQILPFLYLGTEWNASNYDSLVSNGITHILNVSSDVDNFFPDAFRYLNIRVRDVDETDLLKEFDRTNKFIQEARDSGNLLRSTVIPRLSGFIIIIIIIIIIIRRRRRMAGLVIP